MRSATLLHGPSCDGKVGVRAVHAHKGAGRRLEAVPVSRKIGINEDKFEIIDLANHQCTRSFADARTLVYISHKSVRHGTVLSLGDSLHVIDPGAQAARPIVRS